MIQVATPIVGDEEIEAVAEVLRSGMYVSGRRVAEFEEEFADFVETKHAVAVATGTAAIHLTLAASDIGPGDEVIVPPLTFFSTVTAVLHQNAVPVFADIDRVSYCLDPEDVARKVTERTRAIIPVHLYGNVSEMDGINAVAEEHHLLVIEDCAQAHGATYRGAKAGGLGAAGCFSFFATKNMTTGEGGMITTDDDGMAERCRLLRSHGMTDRHTHAFLGYNYRMTEMEAAVGRIQLSRLDELNRRRTRNSEFLRERLADVEWLRVPPIAEHVEHAFFWCPVEVREDALRMDTLELIDTLREQGVEVRHRYLKPLYRQPLLTDRERYPLRCDHYRDAPDYASIRLPNVEEVAGKMIGLPNHPGLTDQALDQVASVLRSI